MLFYILHVFYLSIYISKAMLNCVYLLYISPTSDATLRSDTIDLLLQLLQSTTQSGFYHAICGDFNMHMDKYYSIYFNQPQVATRRIHRLFFHLLSYDYEEIVS